MTNSLTPNLATYVATSIDQRGIATVTMDRREVHNAFDDVMIKQLITTFAQLKADDNVHAVILRANGKNFSAGADLNWMRAMADKDYQENLDDASILAQLMADINFFPKPTIALVQGAAFGGAVGLIACCDIALATPRASFCLSEVKIGLIPAVISPYVVAAIGERQSRRYFLTAERFKADAALTFGLIHEISDDLDAVAAPIIDALLANSPAAMSAAKELINFVSFAAIDSSLISGTAERIAAIRVSDEGQEGLSAFLDKRRPSWIKE
ncbi:MAG: enoyl-CoA hydratase/isomerase family protein [Gammaproteobacteria bacterium]|nr:enoyl-CoA hydratase/isomerase family protein [Gammaproteobacteria bacterium]